MSGDSIQTMGEWQIMETYLYQCPEINPNGGIHFKLHGQLKSRDLGFYLFYILFLQVEIEFGRKLFVKKKSLDHMMRNELEIHNV